MYWADKNVRLVYQVIVLLNMRTSFLTKPNIYFVCISLPPLPFHLLISHSLSFSRLSLFLLLILKYSNLIKFLSRNPINWPWDISSFCLYLLNIFADKHILSAQHTTRIFIQRATHLKFVYPTEINQSVI